MKLRSESLESHLSLAVLIAGYFPCHRHLMDGHPWPALQILAVSCVAALMMAAALRWIRQFQEYRSPYERTRRDDRLPHQEADSRHPPNDDVN